MTTIEELEAALKDEQIELRCVTHPKDVAHCNSTIFALTQAIAIKKGECVVSREMRLTIEGMAKQPLTTEMDEVLKWSTDYTDGYDEMVKHARKLKAMIAAQEEMRLAGSGFSPDEVIDNAESKKEIFDRHFFAPNDTLVIQVCKWLGDKDFRVRALSCKKGWVDCDEKNAAQEERE